MTNRRRRVAALAALLSATSAHAQADRTVLPIPAAPFDGQIADHVSQARPGTDRPVQAPDGAPNVLLFMSDDTGFAMASAFGGPVPTPNFERLAAMGQKYSRFHTAGICSPSRAALLTGRNHHNAGTGYLSDLPSPYPGYGGRILPETATIAQVLRLNGYSTAMWGKHHNTPGSERSEAGPFGTWPTGLGFDRFFGFNGGDVDQFAPILYRDTQRVDAGEAKGRLLDERLADDMIAWLRSQHAGAPGRPFLAYWAPGSTHAPHQARPEQIARFKGQFDQGWDRMREETLRRQIAGGVVPKGTRLTPRPAEIPAWATLTPEQKAFAARSMEVAAAMLAFQDEQFGRVLNELERTGRLNNTLVAVVLGDNGASGEAGPKGSINELRGMGTHDEREAWLHAQTEALGGPETYGNYPVGWAWAMNTPLRWVKQYGSMLGGVRNGMIMARPGKMAKPGGTCAQFGHLVDLVPTVLEAARLPMPNMVLGTAQKPLDGESLLPSLSNCQPAHPRTQYFEIGGKVGLYHNGWFLSGDDKRPAWNLFPPGGNNPAVDWTLYDLSMDFAQGTDLAAREPARLAAMQTLWREIAKKNNVFPLDHRFGPGRVGGRIPGIGIKHFDLWGKGVSIPANQPPLMIARSFTVEADLVLDKPDSSGAVIAMGSKFGGWSLLLDQGRPAFVWSRSTDPQEIVALSTARALPAGKTTLRMRFETPRPGGPADVVLSVGGAELGRARVPLNYLMPAGGGETLDVGRDLGVPVTAYRTPGGELEGDVSHVRIDFD